MFYLQEQPYHLFMPISRSPYEWCHTRTIGFVHIPSVHLYRGIYNFGDAKVRDTMQRRKALAIRRNSPREPRPEEPTDRLPTDRFPKEFGRYVTIELFKKLERKCFGAIRDPHSHVGPPI